MASRAQVAANRKNAAKSTGPRTAQGKACSALNRVTHGLRSSSATIPGEDVTEWERFRKGIVDSLSPADPLEEEIAHRVAVCLWRVRRCGALEAMHATIEERLVNAPAFRDQAEIDDAEEKVEDAKRQVEWREAAVTALEGPSPLPGFLDMPDGTGLDGDRVGDIFREFTAVADTDFDYNRRKYLLAVGLPESATSRPFEWDGWSADLIRKGLTVIAKHEKLDMAAVVADAVSGRKARCDEARKKLATAEEEVRAAEEVVRLVEARRLLTVLLPSDNVVALLHRYEGHHFRQMTEAIETLQRLQRAKATRRAPTSTDDDAD